MLNHPGGGGEGVADANFPTNSSILTSIPAE